MRRPLGLPVRASQSTHRDRLWYFDKCDCLGCRLQAIKLGAVRRQEALELVQGPLPTRDIISTTDMRWVVVQSCSPSHVAENRERTSRMCSSDYLTRRVRMDDKLVRYRAVERLCVELCRCVGREAARVPAARQLVRLPMRSRVRAREEARISGRCCAHAQPQV